MQYIRFIHIMLKQHPVVKSQIVYMGKKEYSGPIIRKTKAKMWASTVCGRGVGAANGGVRWEVLLDECRIL